MNVKRAIRFWYFKTLRHLDIHFGTYLYEHESIDSNNFSQNLSGLKDTNCVAQLDMLKCESLKLNQKIFEDKTVLESN